MERNETVTDVGVVVIGRNEGERFVRCLNSLAEWIGNLVYVDSGSTDGSVARAREAGATVVELDPATPFTAARGRNAGVAALLELGEFTYVQFVDGDCEMAPGWIAAARQYLEDSPDVAAVGGRLRESFPEHSLYNRLCAIEWNTPVGEVRTIGGIGFYRLADFIAAGRFDPALIAGEEPELCLRLRQKGSRIMRIEAEMARHDADILTFSQWWRRMRRNGYGGLDVATRSLGKAPAAEVPFAAMVRSARIWTLSWSVGTLLLALAGGYFAMPAGALAGLMAGFSVWLLQAARIGWGVRRRAHDPATAMAYGLFTLIGKWAQLVGHYHYRTDLRAGRSGLVIEYKGRNDSVSS